MTAAVQIAFFIGIAIVLLSHIFMLAKPSAFDTKQAMQGHSIANLVAVLLLTVGFFIRK